jgi:hypothetical protein
MGDIVRLPRVPSPERQAELSAIADEYEAQLEAEHAYSPQREASRTPRLRLVPR